MTRTRVSSKYQVVIPKKVRERLDLKPGQEMQVMSKGGVIILVPDRPLSAFRGILRGIPTAGYRERPPTAPPAPPPAAVRRGR